VNDINAEVAILGSAMCSNDAVLDAVSILSNECFHEDINRRIFSLMKDLHHKGSPIDQITIAESLPKELRQRVFDIVSAVPSALHSKYYASLVKNLYLERMVSDACLIASKDPSNKENISKLRDAILAMDANDSNVKRMPEMLNSYTAILDERMLGNDFRVKSGLRTFDNVIGGFKRGHMISIGGRPNSGKSALLVKLSINALKMGRKVLYISGEVTHSEMIDRMVAIIGSIDARVLDSSRVREYSMKVTESLEKMNNFPFWFKSTDGKKGGLTMGQIYADVETVQPDMLVIDYLNCFCPTGRIESKRIFLSDVAYQLRDMAIGRNIVLLLACQLNREIEHRNDPTPTLSDFKETGAIEEASHMAILLNPKIREKNEGSSLFPVDLIIAKNKGPMGVINMMFNDKTTDFFEIDHVSEVFK
jgi:replicative DNA helicase